MDKKIIAIIPARGGSKGIPRKNIKDLDGKPMISYIIESVKKAKGVDRVIVSTEDKEIADVAKEYGAEVPFVRPAKLSDDEVATLPVLQHALLWLEENENYKPDYVLLVYPTSPLLKTERIQEAIDICIKRNSDSVVSVEHDKGQYLVEAEGGWKRLYPVVIANRQWMKPLAKINGAIFLTRTEVLKNQLLADKMDVLVMDKGENVDVDHMEDFDKVQSILKINK